MLPHALSGRRLAKAAVAETVIVSQLSLLKRVQEILGVHRLSSDQDLLKLVEDRVPTSAVEGLKRTGLTDDEIYSLIAPRRTLTHRRARREALSREESDRAVRLARSGNGTRDGMEAMRQSQCREDPGAAHAHQAADGARAKLRRRVRLHHAA